MVAPTPFADWLSRQMRLRGFEGNQSKLATYLKMGTSTVNAWFTRGTIPSPEACQRIAAEFNLAPDDVLRIAGHRTLEMTKRYSQVGEEEAAIDAYRRLIG